MRHSGWLILFVAAVAGMWWAGLTGMAVAVTLVCGLAGLAYLVVRTRQPSQEADRERDRRDVQRDIPQPPE
jgi:membrane protein implicated in regulation of membrane protease activity